MRPTVNRRCFLHTSARSVTGIGVVAGMLFHPTQKFAAAGKSSVSVVRNMKAISDRNVCDPKEVRRMIDRGLSDITGKTSPREIWSALGVTETDVVGIKVNCNNARFPLHAHPELVYGLCDSLSEVVPPNNIIIYERYGRELSRAGFILNNTSEGVRCKGTENDGFHATENLTKILTNTCTKLINLPSLKTFEGDFGGTLFLKNHIGSLPPSHMPRCHGNAEMCTEVNARETIRKKTVLGLCDALRGTYTASKPWYFGGIIMSTDIPAAEFTALSVINEKRRDSKVSDINIPSYVQLADTKYHLGTINEKSMNIHSSQL